MSKFTIKVKLILIFILIKIIPLLLVSYIAYQGALKLDVYIQNSTKFLFEESKNIIDKTADASISDSIKYLDKKSQTALERLSFETANKIAEFLYERDKDTLFLSKLDINQKLLEEFYSLKTKDILVHEPYVYDEETKKWKSTEVYKEVSSKKEILKDNKKEFNFINPIDFKKKTIPIYKEISFFDLKGNEKYKVSSINKDLQNISFKRNTYINSEEYFNEIQTLKKDEIYVSNVIGEIVKSKVIGDYTKEKTKKLNIEFEPELSAYAGKENPNGKKFEAIIRFITPVFKNNKKVGYISLALDHEHIMQFTDTLNPVGTNPTINIADASVGNYAFMWDNQARSISHPRDYFISGFDKTTGKRAKPWLSADLAKKYEASNMEINEFLENYPKFEEQSINKKPNITQLLKEGLVPLDCRFLNFAPQCHGWMELTKDGGYGSFIIFWSKVWKLTTAAAIPYYTGQYGDTKRGFGFVTIGANVDEFHAAANETKKSITKILNEQTSRMKQVVDENEFEIHNFIIALINELTIVTVIMVILVIFVALWLSSYISKKIEKLLLGTTKFSNNEFNYRIEITSNDEIGKLEESFNTMASKIEAQLKKEKELNLSLEKRVKEEVLKQREQEKLLIHQSKQASMGEMIGNIAHQWRQPLNALSLVIQNIKFSYEIGDLNKESLDKSVDKAKLLTSNMSNTIDDFRDFFKPNKNKEEFILQDSLDKAISLIEASFINNEIKIIKEYEEKPLSIYGYSNEFSQAVLNIVNNAKDALLEGNISKAQIEIKIFEDDSIIAIEIIDNAKGISEKYIEKIFEPYFSTKDEGKGTGIGLYMTKTIIENNMNGKVFLKETSSNGSSFRIEFKKKSFQNSNKS